VARRPNTISARRPGDLGRADQRHRGDDRVETQSPLGEERDDVEGDASESEALGAEAEREAPEGRPLQRRLQRRAAERLGLGRALAGAAAAHVAQERRIDDSRHELDRREDLQRLAPAERPDEKVGQRIERRRGQPAEKQDRGDGAAVIGDVRRSDGEGQVLHRRRGRKPDADEDEIEGERRRDGRPQEERGRAEKRARRHDEMRPEAVHPPAAGDRGEAGGEETDGQRPVEVGPRPAELRLHRRHEQREGEIERAPADELAERQAPDEDPGRGMDARFLPRGL
jgi:hypothetical protein